MAQMLFCLNCVYRRKLEFYQQQNTCREGDTIHSIFFNFSDQNVEKFPSIAIVSEQFSE